jgi:hypothetical protein
VKLAETFAMQGETYRKEQRPYPNIELPAQEIKTLMRPFINRFLPTL